jgi:DNA-binding CsgD family transcriptional regulator
MLLERDSELRALESAIQAACAGRGRAVLIEGVAGTGKTSLVAAARALAADAGVTILDARGSDSEREFGFGLLRQMFEQRLSRSSPAERDALLAGAARPAGRVLAQAAPVDGTVSDGFATLHAVHWLTLNMAERGPLMLVADDAHWADLSSLRALSYVAGRIADAPVLLLVAFRPTEPGAPEEALESLRAEPDALKLYPRALTKRAVERLVRAQVDGADPALAGAVSEATGGNPFLVNELLTAVQPGDEDDADLSAAVRRAALAPLGERVVRRVARAGEGAAALTAAMAVIGSERPLSQAATIAGVERGQAGEIAHRLRRIEILASEDPFAFSHPLVQRSILDALPASESRALHRAAAQLFADEGASAEAVAAQLAALPPAGSAEVALACLAAAHAAGSRGAPPEAVHWLERALAEDAPEPPRATLLEALGMARSQLRDPVAISRLQEALELAQDADARVRISAALVEILGHAGLWGLAIEELQRRAGDVQDASLESAAEFAAVKALLMVNDHRFWRQIERERSALEQVVQMPGWAPRALAAVLASHSALRGELVVARRLADTALAEGALFAERGGSWASVHALSVLAMAGEYDEALAASDDLQAAAAEQGSTFGLLIAAGVRGWVEILRGNLPAGEAAVRSAWEMANTAELPMMAITGILYLQDAILERPGHDDLIALAESIELDPAFAQTASGLYLLHPRGRFRLAAGDREGAVADLRAALAVQVGLGWGPTALPTRSVLALALPAQQRDEALELVSEELELAHAAGIPRGVGIALRAAGVLQGGQEGLDLLRQSAEVLAAAPARLEQARSLVELGAALRSANRSADAREQLSAGADLAHRCGAQRLVARAQDELRATGARPRRVATTGAAALTPTERRVADLAAQGRTNADIAQELFVSLKTVETHLTNAYVKLGLSGQGSRRRLAGALDG